MIKQELKEFKLLQKIQQLKKGKAATTSHEFRLIAADFYAQISTACNLKPNNRIIEHVNGPQAESSSKLRFLMAKPHSVKLLQCSYAASSLYTTERHSYIAIQERHNRFNIQTNARTWDTGKRKIKI